LAKENDVVIVDASIDEFAGKLQLTIKKMAKSEEYEIKDFIDGSKFDTQKQFNKLLKYISSVKNQYLLELLESIFVKDTKFAEKFRKATAAERAHHAWVGGLLDHILELLDMVDPICEHYSSLDKDLVLTGIILHDIGKVEELTIDKSITRTRSGYLIGHLSLGALFIDKKIDTIKNFPENLRDQVVHLILSHHGKLEWGSPVKPMTIEALLLHYLDNISSKLNIATKIINDTSKEEIFTNFAPLLESRLYMNNESIQENKVSNKEDNKQSTIF
jgi:3'-5' exoribonuclease